MTNEAFWFASENAKAYERFLAIVKNLYSHIVLDFFHGNYEQSNAPMYHQRALESDSLYRSVNSTRDTLGSKRRLTQSYSSITNIFGDSETLLRAKSSREAPRESNHEILRETSHEMSNDTPHETQKEETAEDIQSPHASKPTPTDSMKSSLVSNPAEVNDHKRSPISSTVHSSPMPLDGSLFSEEGVWLPKLEEPIKRIKTISGELMRLLYSITSVLDVWKVLQRIDDFVNAPQEAVGDAERDEVKRREVAKIVECIQESLACNAVFWTPIVRFYSVGIFRWKYPELAAILRGKQEFHAKDLQPTTVSINKLYRYERQIGDGRYSSVWIVESRLNHKFYALKKIPSYSLDPYEKEALQVGMDWRIQV